MGRHLLAAIVALLLPLGLPQAIADSTWAISCSPPTWPCWSFCSSSYAAGCRAGHSGPEPTAPSRRRRRGPKVCQDRGRAVESIARSAPSGAAAPLPRGGLVGRGFCGRLAPRGGMTSGDPASRRGRGTRVAGVGSSVGFRVGSSVGLRASATVAPGRVRQGCGACQRSSTRRRRVPSPPPTVAGEAGSRAGRQGRMAAP